MKQLCKAALTVAISSVFCVHTADAGLSYFIDFGSDYRTPDTGIVVLDDQFDDVFEQVGIRFSSPTSNPIYWTGSDYGFQAGASSITMGNPNEPGPSNHPLRIDFLTPVLFASIQGIDGGHDVDTVTIRAFSSDNILLDQDSVTHTFGSQQTISVGGLGIDYILIEQPGTSSGVFLDNLAYVQHIPAPATLAVLMLGFAIKPKR